MQFEADEEQAMREHDKLLDGGIVNEQAAKQANEQLMMSIMQGGEVDPMMLQQSVEAGLQPLAYENKAVHLEVHSQFMKSAEFEALPEMIKDQFYKHFEFTQQAVAAEASPAGEAPRVSLQLRGAVGPTAGSEILTNAGIKNVTPQTLLEPPLDTVVIDNKDKPNAEEGVGGELNRSQLELLQKLQQDQAMADQKLVNEQQRMAVRGE
jgi:hypothetical protein